jgi:HEAT repeat protein
MEPISYFNMLLADPRITMLQILDMQHPLEVARVYVQLRISEERQQRYATPANDEESTRTTEDDPDVWVEEERQRRERRVEVIYDPEKAISTFHRSVIMGDPGAGKTTLLRHLTIMAAQGSIAGMPSLLPIYVELQSFVRSGLHDLLDFVSATWEEAYAFPAWQVRLLLANYFDEGKALLLLDALNETPVGETSEAAEQSYEAVSQSILNIAAAYPKASMVVTTRKASYKQHRPLVSFTPLELMDFRFEDVKQFVHNWYDAAHDLHAEEKSADLIKRLDANPRLQTMAANPLLLTLIVLAYENRLDLPERRAELYRICIETLLTKWDARRGIRSGSEFEPEQKHQLLKVIAWHFHRKRQRYFTERDLLQMIAEFLPTINVLAERNDDILQAIESEQGVLKEQTTGWHGFLHLTLQEYFAAEYINDHVEARFIAPAELLRRRSDAWWEEVLLLCMGITPDASFFLQQLCSQKSTIREDIFYTNALLAGRCLSARPTVRETGLRAQIIERLFELLMSTQYSLLRQEAIEVLCSIGVFETNSRLIALLADERLHAFVRWNIADALGTLGERSVARDLVQLLADERLSVDLRRSIADALGTLGERSVAGDLVQLLADDQQDVDLRRSIAGALGRLGERSVAGDLVQLLADERLDVDLRRSIADALGELGEQSVAEDLVQLLADDQQDVDLRRSIADALGELGEWSVVASAMVQLLADDQQDVFVRRRITGALGTLAEGSGRLAEGLERSVAGDLVQLLTNEWLDADLRMSIADALGMLGERSVAGELVQLLADEQLDVNVRRAIAIALGKLGERSVAARALVQLLSDQQQDTFVRRSITGALGTLGERSVARDLMQLLSDERLDVDLRWSIADALGRLGERSVTGELMQLLADDQLDVNVQRSIAIALGALGERQVAARAMVQLLSGDQFGVFAQRSIASALGALGERSVARDLVQLLSEEHLHTFVRRKIADALGRLAEVSVARDLVQLLSDERLDVDLRRSIASALAAYANDISTVEGLIKSLQDQEISDSVYSALWTISKRTGVWIFPNEIVPWE